MFKPTDLLLIPCFYLILFTILHFIIVKYDAERRRLFLRTFHVKMFCSIAFTLIMAFYYKGGDTELYFFATRDIQKALDENAVNIFDILFTLKFDIYHPLAPYFAADNSVYPVILYMRAPSNFFVPKIALIPSIISFTSFPCICMMFSFISLGGAIRLYKFFLHYNPFLKREIGFAVLLLPSVCYWSSGLLKDSICFASIGFLMYGILNVFVKRKKIISSGIWIVISVALLYYIKAYILLALLPGILFWLSGEISKILKEPILKRTLAFMTFILCVIFVFYLIDYLTSSENLQSFRLDKITETTKTSRAIYKANAAESISSGSYFQVKTSNPVLLFLNGILATFFRPFPWDITSPIVILSAIESFLFLVLTLYFIFKKGIISFFRNLISSPIMLLCTIFSLIFAGSIGSASTNFGSLVRYKIPCLPFFLFAIFSCYYNTGFQYPQWIKSLIYKWVPGKPLKNSH